MAEPTERDRNIAMAIFTPWLGIPNTVPLVWEAIAAARAEERERWEPLSPACAPCPEPKGTCFPGPCKLYRAGKFRRRTDHWSVTVRRNGDEIVTIESNCLSGREISPEDEEAIRVAARNLLGFIGET